MSINIMSHIPFSQKCMMPAWDIVAFWGNPILLTHTPLQGLLSTSFGHIYHGDIAWNYNRISQCEFFFIGLHMTSYHPFCLKSMMPARKMWVFWKNRVYLPLPPPRSTFDFYVDFNQKSATYAPKNVDVSEILSNSFLMPPSASQYLKRLLRNINLFIPTPRFLKWP